MRDIMSRGAAGNGDINGDGYVKLSIYATSADLATAVASGGSTPASFTYTGKGGNVLNVLKYAPMFVDPSKLIIEVIPGPGTTDDPSKVDYATALSKLFDTHNDTTGIDDGLPDFVVGRELPQFYQGVLSQYHAGGYDTAHPEIAIVNGSSFLRTANLLILGTLANGQEGVAPLLYTSDASGMDFAQSFQQVTGFAPAGYDSNVYDAMVVSLLGVLKAALPLSDPSTVTPSQVKVALDQINVPGAQIVRTGPTEFQKGIEAIAAGTDINYEGASGSVDFDANNNVAENVEIFSVANQQWVTRTVFSCSTDPTCPAIQ
jgi:hypothetical protein